MADRNNVNSYLIDKIDQQSDVVFQNIDNATMHLITKSNQSTTHNKSKNKLKQNNSKRTTK